MREIMSVSLKFLKLYYHILHSAPQEQCRSQNVSILYRNSSMDTLKCITLRILIWFDAYFWIVPDVLGRFIIQATYDLLCLTFRWRNYFLILAHPVYKIWITQEPNALELWNKLHFEEKKNGEYIPCLKYSVLNLLNKYIKCNLRG